MKRHILVLTMICMMVFSLSAQTVEKTYHFDKPYFECHREYKQIIFDGCVQMAEEGCPSMPWQPVTLLLPYNTEAKSIHYEFLDFVEIEGEHQIYPYQQARPLSTMHDMPLRKNDDVYNSVEVYPSQHDEVTTQFLNGYSIATSGFSPVRYIPSTAKLSYASTVKVTVTYSSSRSDKSKMLRNTPDNEARLSRLAHNPEMISSYESREVKSIEGYELLVVTPSQWVSHFDGYKEFYDTQGLRTKVVALEDIYSSFDGRDEQEKIRAFISHEYENEGIMMVLLGGDVELVPHRGLYCFVTIDHKDSKIPADMYYVCLDGDWNNDNDTLWGEVGEYDLMPELAIARLPFNNEEQLNNMLRKTIEYQTNPVVGEFNDIVFGAEHLGDGYYGNNDLELLIGEQNDSGYTTIGIPRNYKFHRYYATPDMEWSGADFKDMINEVGGGYVYHVGHANAEHVAGWEISEIDDAFFHKLNGVDHNYSFFHTHGCICGDFSSDCILERMIEISTGYVAVVGNSRYGWYVPGTDGPARHLNRELVDAYYNDRLKYIGTAFLEAKIMTAPLVNVSGKDNASLRWNIYCINVLGDVAAAPWLDEPFVPEVYYKPVLPVGTSSTTVVVKKDDKGENNFRCSLFHDDRLLAFGMTDDDGNAKLRFAEPLNVTDTMRLVVTGPNAACHVYDVLSVDENATFIYADDVVVDDSEGNSNGRLDYGEKAKIDVEFLNLGNEDVNDITAVLSTTSSDIVEIIEDEVKISVINANSTQTINEAFSIKINDNVEDNDIACFTLTFTYDGDVYKQDLQYKILAPNLKIIKAKCDDSNGDSDGIVDVGETVQFQISGKNAGHSSCNDVLIKAVSNNDNIVFVNNEKNVSQLNQGATFMTTFSFTASDDIQEGTVVDIEVVVGSGFYETRKTVRFAVGRHEVATDELSHQGWRLYPNPVDDSFKVEGDNIKNVELYNVMGTKLMSHDMRTSNIIDMTDLPNGLYLVRIIDDDDNVIVRKIVKK